MGDAGCLSFWGDKPARHRSIAEHAAAEYFVRTEGRGRAVDEWKERPGKPDNHWWDCLVGNAVAASMLGVTESNTQQKKRTARNRGQKLSLSERRARNRGR